MFGKIRPSQFYFISDQFISDFDVIRTDDIGQSTKE